jgi:hypothetical protein
MRRDHVPAMSGVAAVGNFPTPDSGLAGMSGPRDADGNETAAGMIGVVVVDDGRTPLADMSSHTHH